MMAARQPEYRPNIPQGTGVSWFVWCLFDTEETGNGVAGQGAAISWPERPWRGPMKSQHMSPAPAWRRSCPEAPEDQSIQNSGT
jgi:hypothetical protein